MCWVTRFKYDLILCIIIMFYCPSHRHVPVNPAPNLPAPDFPAPNFSTFWGRNGFDFRTIPAPN